MVGNSHPKNIVNTIIKCVLSKEKLPNDVISNEEKVVTQTVYINIVYPGEKDEYLEKEKF